MIARLRDRFLAMFTERLKYPQLFGLLATLFVVDLVLPDFIPFVDELMLGLLTALVGSIKERSAPGRTGEPPVAPTAKPPEKNVTPPRAAG
jgi:hypothetical protein